MKLIQFKHRETLVKYNYREDFGHEYYVQFINTGRHFPNFIKNRSLLQMSFSWNDYPSWPYIQITSGSNGLLGIVFWVYKLGFDVDVLSRTWNFERLEELDVEEEEIGHV